ncbi:MAG: fibronectin type III-like domain-contianing protein [Lachnospiraceae bacterium]
MKELKGFQKITLQPGEEKESNLCHHRGDASFPH